MPEGMGDKNAVGFLIISMDGGFTAPMVK